MHHVKLPSGEPVDSRIRQLALEGISNAVESLKRLDSSVKGSNYDQDKERAISTIDDCIALIGACAVEKDDVKSVTANLRQWIIDTFGLSQYL